MKTWLILFLFRKDWKLDSVPHVSPLEGGIVFQLNCYSESQVLIRWIYYYFDLASNFHVLSIKWNTERAKITKPLAPSSPSTGWTNWPINKLAI